MQLFAAAIWSRPETGWTLLLKKLKRFVHFNFRCHVTSSRCSSLCCLSIICVICEIVLLLGFVIQTLYLYPVSSHFPVGCVSVCESDMENRAQMIQSGSSLVADALHGFGRGERSGKLQRHRRVWTAAAWPLQVGTRRVAHTSLHYTLVLLMPWWGQGSFQCMFKQNHKSKLKIWDVSISSHA